MHSWPETYPDTCVRRVRAARAGGACGNHDRRSSDHSYRVHPFDLGEPGEVGVGGRDGDTVLDSQGSQMGVHDEVAG